MCYLSSSLSPTMGPGSSHIGVVKGFRLGSATLLLEIWSWQDVIQGMRVGLTHNVDKQRGFVNGTLAEVQHILSDDIFPDRECGSQCTPSRSEVTLFRRSATTMRPRCVEPKGRPSTKAVGSSMASWQIRATLAPASLGSGGQSMSCSWATARIGSGRK